MHSTLHGFLTQLGASTTLGAYTQAAREIAGSDLNLEVVRVAVLASFTADQMRPFLQVEAARQGYAVDLYFGPFNTVRLELLNPASGCHAHRPDVVFAAQLLNDACPALATDLLALSESQIDELIEQVTAETAAAAQAFRKHSDAVLVVHNFAAPPALGIFEPMAAQSRLRVIERLNNRLVDAVSEVSGVFVLDFRQLCGEVGRGWLDRRMWHLARAPLSAPMLAELARTQAAFLLALRGGTRKCLVLDLDNTLWGGVIGEAGLGGIALGHTYPGCVFREFQQLLLELHRRGILLAVNSKNNPADAEEVFAGHPDMVLRREQIASFQANWLDKPSNMRAIAAELNIGLDSLVFFDDNPAERELMRQELPEVLTLEAPPDPVDYVDCLIASHAFEKLSFTTEDRQRGAMYQQRVELRRLERSATSLDDFLLSLGMKAVIAAVDEFTFPRALDLLHKTNQFNLTTRRHSASELRRTMGDSGHGVFTLQLTDRFGDHGVVGLAIVSCRERKAAIDTLLLSCRVIGRSAETALLAFLADWGRARGAQMMEGEFIPTKKNEPAARFLPDHGFEPVDPAAAPGGAWTVSLKQKRLDWPEAIEGGGLAEGMGHAHKRDWELII